MGELAAVIILLTALAYLILRILLFVNLARRGKQAPAKEQEGPSGS